MITLTRDDLIKALYSRVATHKVEASDMVETFFEEIRAQLEQGNSVKLSNFGNFQLLDKRQRPGRNPKTGEVSLVSARRVVAFHPSLKLKGIVEKNNKA